MANINIIVIFTAFFIALFAIYILYAVFMHKERTGKGNELQLTTKKIQEQVEVLYDKGEYELVQLLATNYLDRNPSHRKVRECLAKAYYKDHKFNNTIKQCLILLKRDNNNITVRKLLADSYIRKEMLQKAIKEYEMIYDHRSNDKDIVKTLARLYKETDQPYAAISVYNALLQLLDSKEDVAKVNLILAELNESVRDYASAFENYKSRLSVFPTDINTNQKLAELYIKLNNRAKAIETLLYVSTIVTEPKHFIKTYEGLIDLYVEEGDYNKAIEFSNKLLEIPGADKFKVRNNIAEYNIKLNNYTQGIAILEDLAEMSGNSYDVTVALAQSYTGCKEFEKALEKYNTLLDKATPREAKNLRKLLSDFYVAWAAEMTVEDKIEESYRYLNNAEEYNPLNSEVFYNRAVNNIIQRNLSGGIGLMYKAIDLDKTNQFRSKYLLKLAEAHHESGNFFEENKALADLLKADPKNAMGLYKTGLMYVSQHDPKNAEEYFNRALEADPDLIQAKYNLALLYESSNTDRAKELFIEILEQNPDYIEAKNALADLESSEYY